MWYISAAILFLVLFMILNRKHCSETSGVPLCVVRPPSILKFTPIYFTERTPKWVILNNYGKSRHIKRGVYPKWPQNIELQTWHEVILRDHSIVAITRNICDKKQMLVEIYLLVPLAEIVMSYVYRSLKIQKSSENAKLAFGSEFKDAITPAF